MRKETYVRLDRHFCEEMTDFLDVMRYEAAKLVNVSPDDLPVIIVDETLPKVIEGYSVATGFGQAAVAVRINPSYLLTIAESVSDTQFMETIPEDQPVPAVLYVTAMYGLDLMLGPLYPPDPVERDDLISTAVYNTRQAWEQNGRKIQTIHF